MRLGIGDWGFGMISRFQNNKGNLSYTHVSMRVGVSVSVIEYEYEYEYSEFRMTSEDADMDGCKE